MRSAYLPKYYERNLLKHYDNPVDVVELKGIISMQDQFFTSGGLVDRIKGIISGYWLATQMNLDFHVYVKDLNDPILSILHQKNVNVIQDKTKLSFSKNTSGPVVWYNAKPGNWEVAKRKIVKKKQVHLYCNMDLLFLMNYLGNERRRSWSEAFNTVFDISKHVCLTSSLESQSTFIGVHLRFIGLLGDFRDLRLQSLTEFEKNKMIAWCKNEIEKISDRHDNPVIVVADSPEFLSELKSDVEKKNVPYKYIIDSTAIGHTALDESKIVFNRAVSDFHSLSKCKKVYQLRYGKMHNSDFSRYAAMVNQNDFELVDNDASN